MGTEFKDVSGEPRSDADIEYSLRVVEERIVKADMSDPELFMELVTIRDALRELLGFRELVKQVTRKRIEDGG